jgi:uncharacterized protein YecA (UPF0149 family)
VDTRDGKIYSKQELADKFKELTDEEVEDEMKHFKEMVVSPTEIQTKRNPPKVGRNEPCPCGSGLKFKKCCLEAK